MQPFVFNELIKVAVLGLTCGTWALVEQYVVLLTPASVQLPYSLSSITVMTSAAWKFQLSISPHQAGWIP